jgi:hypothetical protein
MAAISTILASGCAQTSTLPLTADTVQITTSAAAVCGRTGAQSVAVRRAAFETLQRGFERFVIQDQDYENNVRVVGHTPVQAHTYSTATVTGRGNFARAHSTSNTYVTGGQPIIAGSHDQGLIVKMFREGDPAGTNAVSAKETLGPDWKKQLEAGPGAMC